MSRSPFNDFVVANRAFELFTLAEREQALERFAELRYPSIVDRFFEAVHSVIKSKDDQPTPPGETPA